MDGTGKTIGGGLISRGHLYKILGFPFGVEHCVVVRRGAHDARATQPPLRLQPIRGSSR
jgi:hypothetical protein